ncbi:MAG: Fe-S cluster assembly protein SufD [Nitrosomonas sp.]|nr:Fe-S cluster assembly protein SufD [Nitrosomonas sp.]
MNTPVKDDYLQEWLAFWKSGKVTASAHSANYLDRLRTSAADCVATLKFPSIRDEEWRFTDITPLKRAAFKRPATETDLTTSGLAQYFADESIIRVVFVDGQYAPELSNVSTQDGVIVDSLSALAETGSPAVTQYLGRLADYRDNIFVALNTAFMQEGAGIIISENITVSAPVHVLFVATQEGVTACPRCLLVAGAGASVTLIEEYLALTDCAYTTNAVIEVQLADSANVSHIRLQHESREAFHVANTSVHVTHAACYRSISIVLGAQISRFDQHVLLADPHAQCGIDGLTLISGQQLADTHTWIDHAEPQGTSRQLHKCIADDSAHAVFSGKITVHTDAQQTDARQMNRSLLLSGKASVDTKPQLEIFADDVKCSHGATVGQLDQDALFYLQSRGLNLTSARNLLVYAFGAEIIDFITIASVKRRLADWILTKTRIE